MMYADIIVDISHEKLDRSFQYKVPEELEQEIQVGMVVTIPFGNGNHERKGYVIGLSDKPVFDTARMKALRGICNSEETTEARLITLAAWMKNQYGSTMVQALKTVLPVREKVKAKEKRYVVLNISQEDAHKLAEELESSRCKARARLLRALADEKKLDYTRASRELGMTTSVIRPLLDQGIIRVTQDEVYRMAVDGAAIPRESLPVLTEVQQAAFAQITEEWKKETPRPVLIHGVTGSGKTQVYMKLIQQVIDEGRQAIVLIPEIALTYQTVRRFYGWFGDKVSVLNSRLSAGERYDQFKRAKRGEIQIMVGPRSALFTPFSRLGLIIIDEEHEQTYKSENSPRYHARETALYRAKMEHAKVVLGSATPSLEAYTRAVQGEYLLVKLNARFADRPLPEVSVVDLREELKAGNRSVLSRKLKDAVEKRLERGEQSVLFLNRRGYAGFVSCRSCGTAMKCPHCDVALTEHNNGRLVCHYCGYERPRVEKCPSCGSPYIGGFKAGTQQIEQILRKTFPKARILRMDYDTTRTKGSYEKILSSFAAHEADILVGTQMIVKGHDFPDVTLVGAVAADLSLNAADYCCAERTFQLLTQAVGRSGRGRRPGEAIIQSYHPEHYSIQAAARQDYEAFYQEEMSYRVLMDYPPAAHMLSVLASGENEELLDQGMEYLAKFVERISAKYRIHVIGPAYATVGKVNDIYRKVLYLKHQDGHVLQDIKNKTEKYIEVNSGFRKLYIQFDYI
ncbi:replication restart helicase PriA [Blautia sp. MSJ-19]|uniref:replication restart helicase PriA n=1 Tax=Blautia sp. MSJ-19 TaxID=2841517 RepID=UPI001C0EA0C3|nr:primosomal protein N' [Blautia sp. MSJ-19]MBU5480403.1 primosomal protein N' [Blautia sp. MSJ-19]